MILGFKALRLGKHFAFAIVCLLFFFAVWTGLVAVLGAFYIHQSAIITTFGLSFKAIN